MSYELLILVATGQLALLLLLLAGMTMARITRVVLGRVLARETDEIHALVRRWLDGEIDDEPLLEALTMSSEDSVSETVRAYSGLIGGDRWEAFVLLVRRSGWYGRIRHQVTSRLWWRRLAAARALALVGAIEDAELVERLMRDRRDAVRLATVRVLKRVPQPALLAAVFEQATQAPAVLRGYLFDVLTFHDRLVSPAVLAGLRSVGDVGCCRAALEFVEQVHDPIYMADALALLVHPLAEIRAVAARAVAVFPHQRTSRELIKRLADADPNVRAAACASLGNITALEAIDGLAARLADSSSAVRLSAALSLRQFGIRGVRVLENAMSQAEMTMDPRLARYVMSLEEDALLDQGAPGAFV